MAVLRDAFRHASHRAAREREPLVLVALHLAVLRDIRRDRGPAVADDVLRRMAGVVADTLRKSDVVARGSGDALVALLPGTQGAGAAVVGALAAATADTWASEVGTALRGPTRLVTTWARVDPGRSGGVSAAGSAAGLCGALLVGVTAALLGFAGGGSGMVLAAVAAGLGGMTLDSVLGAAVEGRYRWIDTDVINAAGTLAGALAGWVRS